jgi:glycosyltransferase involved in cell wall biosynthesis
MFCPAYYDELNIPKVVEGAIRVLEELELADYEITIVEDGSPDRTGEVADEMAARYEKVRVIHHEVNRGYGAALKTGFESARFEYVFYTDGDNQFDLDELKRFVALLPYTDIVSGFRIEKQYSTYRKFTSFIYNLILRILFDIPDRDVDCAFKLYPTELFSKFTIESRDAFIDAEIAIKARLLGYQSVEVGVRHLPRMDGISTGARPSVIFRTIGEILRFHRKYKERIQAVKEGRVIAPPAHLHEPVRDPAKTRTGS